MQKTAAKQHMLLRRLFSFLNQLVSFSTSTQGDTMG